MWRTTLERNRNNFSVKVFLNVWFYTWVRRGDSQRKIGEKRVSGREGKCSCPETWMPLACGKDRKKIRVCWLLGHEARELCEGQVMYCRVFKALVTYLDFMLFKMRYHWVMNKEVKWANFPFKEIILAVLQRINLGEGGERGLGAIVEARLQVISRSGL